MTALASGIIVTTPEQLAAVVREQLDAALAEHDANRRPVPLLVSGADMAALIGVSRATLHRMRVEQDCPSVQVCEVYKYEPAAVMDWLRARGRA